MFGKQGRVRMVTIGNGRPQTRCLSSGANELVMAVLAIVLAAAAAVPLMDLMSRL
jgi:hypothetical protein